jgi:hypothetical protein
VYVGAGAACAAVATLAIVVCASCSSSSSGSGDTNGTDAGDASASADGANAVATDAATNADGASALHAGDAEAFEAGGTPGIACHGSTCTAGAFTCCQAKAGGAFVCEPLANAPNTCQVDTAKDCDDWVDCAPMSLVCCGMRTGDGTDFYASSCMTTQQCAKTAANAAVVCAVGAANACPSGAPCAVPDGGGKVGFCEGLF